MNVTNYMVKGNGILWRKETVYNPTSNLGINCFKA